MTDEETVEAILDKAHDKCELTASHDVPYLRATLLDLVRAARQPVAHEVPGFHVTQMDGWGRVTTREAGLVVRTKGAEHDD